MRKFFINLYDLATDSPLSHFFGGSKGEGCRKSGSERRLQRAYLLEFFYLHYVKLSVITFDNGGIQEHIVLFANNQNREEENKLFV